MDNYEDDYDWGEQDDEPNDGQIFDERFWQELLSSGESCFTDETPLWENTNESQNIKQIQPDANSLEIANRFNQRELQQLPDWENRPKSYEELVNSMVADFSARYKEALAENERDARYSNGSIPKYQYQPTVFYRKPVSSFGLMSPLQVIIGIVVTLLIITVLFDVPSLIRSIREPQKIVSSDRSSVSNYSNSSEYDSWGCPDGCTFHKDGCDIKGNKSFNTGAKIYHVPGQTFYADTVINPDYGERWFCTEEEARDNGWRKSSN